MKLMFKLAGGSLPIVASIFIVTTANSAEPRQRVVTDCDGQVIQTYGNTEILNKKPVECLFRHSDHAISHEISCDSCHPDIFAKKRGAAKQNGDYTMASFNDGKYCGACHDGTSAFSTSARNACISCHGSNMVAPTTLVFSQPLPGVPFSHVEHMEQGMECSSCHNEIFKTHKGSAESNPKQFTMQAMYEGKYCGACHDGKIAFDAANKGDCLKCHKSEQIEIKTITHLYEPVQFPHDMHTEIADCQECHHHTLGQEPLDKHCAQCHEQSLPSENIKCSQCHLANSFSVKEVEKTANTNMYHIDKPGLKGAFHLNCVGCHQEQGGPTGCQECHAFTPDGEKLFHLNIQTAGGKAEAAKDESTHQGEHK